MTQGIYEIVNLYDGKATAYVGSTQGIKRRWRRHAAALRRGTHHNTHLQRAWDRDGADAFGWSIIEEVVDASKLLEREQYWLNRYLENHTTCYNIATTAGPAGPVSEEAKRRMSEAAMGRTPWNKGKKLPPLTEACKDKLSKALKGNQHTLGLKHTEETKRKMREAHKGKKYALGCKHTEAARRNNSEAHMGKKLSKETRRKISEAHTGKKHTKDHVRKIGEANARCYPAFYNVRTNAIILSGINLSAMCRKHKLHMSSMHAVAHGQRKSHKGWVLMELLCKEDLTRYSMDV